MKKIIFAGVVCMWATAFAAGCSGAKESSKTDGSGAAAASGGSSVYYVKNEDSQAVGFSGFTKEDSAISSDADLKTEVSGNESISSYTSNVNRNVYAEPDLNSAVIGRIECNDVVYIVDGYDSNDWYLLSYNGRAAYVPAVGEEQDENVYELFSPYYSDNYSYYDGPYGGNEWQEYYGDWDDFYYGDDEGYDDGSDGGSSDEPDNAGDESSEDSQETSSGDGQETSSGGSESDTETVSADNGSSTDGGAGSNSADGNADGNADAGSETETAGGEN